MVPVSYTHLDVYKRQGQIVEMAPHHLLRNRMSDKTLSKNLIAAGLFDVAYSADITDDTSDTMIELFRFCAIGLEHAGIDVYELLEELVFDTCLLYTSRCV